MLPATLTLGAGAFLMLGLCPPENPFARQMREEVEHLQQQLTLEFPSLAPPLEALEFEMPEFATPGIESVGMFINAEDDLLGVEVVPADAEEDASVVQIAICLDTSGSMDGLINAARQKLWSIVNDLALAKPTPELRVALLTYGNDGQAQENGWVKVFTPFTDDLDKVSEMLFALTTNGGTELVGRVIQTSIEELEWHESDDALKLIIVAGNESADQDQQVLFRDACKAAISRGVMVNSIYCRYSGDAPEVEDGWREVARLADGQYASIDQNNTAVVIATPHDDDLIALSTRLNGTYLPFGGGGEAGWANQQAQDANAALMNKAAAAARAQTKGGALYYCSWDLVDACREGGVKLADIKDEDLPENMRTMTLEERQAYIASMQAKRAEIQKQMEDLNAKRMAYVIAEQKRQSANGVDQFDLIIRNAIRTQAEGKGLALPDPEADVSIAEAERLPYFVQIGNVWVASNLAAEYERSLAAQKPLHPQDTIEEATEQYDAYLATLDEPMRKALISIEEGNVLIRQQDGAVRLVVMKSEPGAEGDGAQPDTRLSAYRGQGMTQQQAAQTLTVAPQNANQSRQIIVQQQEVIVPQEDLAEPFVKRGAMWVEASYVADYDALVASNEAPTFDETLPNTPEGREALLARVEDDGQRKALESIFADLGNLMEGGVIVKLDGKLVFLQFGC